LDTFAERHYTLAEIAAMLNVSREKARRLFHDEPGMIRFHGTETSSREYSTYRIQSVAGRVRLRLMNISYRMPSDRRRDVSRRKNAANRGPPFGCNQV
jgi:hypothetical protein